MTTDPTGAQVALREARAVAVHSPSSHNAQAWTLHVNGDPEAPELELAVDRGRALRALPAHEIEMLLGLGTYWHAMAVTLRARGWALEHRAGPPASLRARMVRTAPDRTAGEEIALLVRRRTDRGPYTGDPIDADVLADIVVSARTRPAWAPAAGPAPDARVVTDPDALARVADLTRRVAPRDFLHRRAWAETARHLHRDAVAPWARTGFGHGQVFGSWPWPLDHVVVVLTSSALMPLTGRLGLAAALAGRLSAALAAGPGLLVLAAPEGSDGWAPAGTDLHRAWLAAARHGLSVHPVSVLLQHDDARRELEGLLDLAGRAFFVARIGHGVPGRVSAPIVRRPPEDVLCGAPDRAPATRAVLSHNR